MTIASITALATSADARPKHRQQAQAQPQVTCDMRGCTDNPTAVAARKAQRTGRSRGVRTPDTNEAYTARAEQRAAQVESQVDANGNAVIVGGRPPGCPHRFCGCEASLYLFGEIRKDLNLASNWIRKFPRTQPAPGMVAARSGHVFVLMSHVDGNQWLVHDGNSGGGKTRRHVRSIAGYVIVNPRATAVAEKQ